MSDWKPGDVAMVTGRWLIGEDHITLRAYRDGGMWCDVEVRFREVADWEVSEVRPLVVIDPEDAEQVERLMCEVDHLDAGLSIVAWQAALREFAAPTPPKCDAALNLAGHHIPCDGDAGHEIGHHNADASAIWCEATPPAPSPRIRG